MKTCLLLIALPILTGCIIDSEGEADLEVKSIVFGAARGDRADPYVIWADFEVFNAGDETAKEVSLVVDIIQNGRTIERSDYWIGTLKKGATEFGTINFNVRGPGGPATVRARVVWQGGEHTLNQNYTYL